jgi:1-acyl-sn-glycerol-3-phosphate acyltransferase
MLSYILGLTRPAFYSLRFFLSILFYLASLFWNKETTRNALIFRDFIIRILNFLLGIRLHIYGNPVVQGLIVANHRSYFDPIIMLNHRHLSRREKGSRIMAAHRIPLQNFRSNFVDRKDPESRQDTRKN